MSRWIRAFWFVLWWNYVFFTFKISKAISLWPVSYINISHIKIYLSLILGWKFQSAKSEIHCCNYQFGPLSQMLWCASSLGRGTLWGWAHVNLFFWCAGFQTSLPHLTCGFYCSTGFLLAQTSWLKHMEREEGRHSSLYMFELFCLLAMWSQEHREVPANLEALCFPVSKARWHILVSCGSFTSRLWICYKQSWDALTTALCS